MLVDILNKWLSKLMSSGIGVTFSQKGAIKRKKKKLLKRKSMAYNLEKDLLCTRPFIWEKQGYFFPFVFLAHQIDLPKTHHKEMKKQLLCRGSKVEKGHSSNPKCIFWFGIEKKNFVISQITSLRLNDVTGWGKKELKWVFGKSSTISQQNRPH